MAGLSRRLAACLHTGQLALLAILVSGGIVLQILACAFYDNWWPLLSFLTIVAALMYVILLMPLLFFVGSNNSSLVSNEGDRMPRYQLGKLHQIRGIDITSI